MVFIQFFFNHSGTLRPGANIYRVPRLGLVKEGKPFELMIKLYFISHQEITSCIGKKHAIVKPLFET